jgi:hypothetical protein
MVNNPSDPVDLAEWRSRRQENPALPDDVEDQAAQWKNQLGTKERAGALAARHPDLAKRLTEPPFAYTEPSQWDGFIPPRLWREQINDSPLRRVLVEVCAEAWRRENNL